MRTLAVGWEEGKVGDKEGDSVEATAVGSGAERVAGKGADCIVAAEVGDVALAASDTSAATSAAPSVSPLSSAALLAWAVGQNLTHRRTSCALYVASLKIPRCTENASAQSLHRVPAFAATTAMST